MHGVMIFHGWAESASTGLKLATVCVSFTSAESCAKLQYTMLSLISQFMMYLISINYQY